MKFSGLWKKRISLWLSAAMVAGNVFSSAAPVVYAQDAGSLDSVQSETEEITADHVHEPEELNRIYDSETGCDKAEMICMVCDETWTEQVPHVHKPGPETEVRDEAAGMILTQVRCTDCDAILESQEEAHAHVPDFYLEYDPETNQETGEYKCLECGEITEILYTRLHEHNPESRIEVLENGASMETVICETCGEIFERKLMDSSLMEYAEYSLNEPFLWAEPSGLGDYGFYFELEEAQTIRLVHNSFVGTDLPFSKSMYRIEGTSMVPISLETFREYSSEEEGRSIIEKAFLEAGFYYVDMNLHQGRCRDYIGVLTDDAQYCQANGHMYRAERQILNHGVSSCLLCGAFEAETEMVYRDALDTAVKQIEQITLAPDQEYQDLIFELSEEETVCLYSKSDFDTRAELFYISDHNKTVWIAEDDDSMGGLQFNLEGPLTPGRYCLRCYCAGNDQSREMLVFLMTNMFNPSRYCNLYGHLNKEAGRVYLADRDQDRIAYICRYCGEKSKKDVEHVHRYTEDSRVYDSETGMDRILHSCICGDFTQETAEHTHEDMWVIESYDGEWLTQNLKCTGCGRIEETDTGAHHLLALNAKLTMDPEHRLKVEGDFHCSDPGCAFCGYGVLDYVYFSSGTLAFNQPRDMENNGNTTVFFYSFETEKEQQTVILLDRYTNFMKLYKEENGTLTPVSPNGGGGYYVGGRYYQAYDKVLAAGTYYLAGGPGSYGSIQLANEDYCSINDHLQVERQRSYDSGLNKDRVLYGCLICHTSELQYEEHQHVFNNLSYDDSIRYDAEQNKEYIVPRCVCGAAGEEEIRDHLHDNWINEKIQSYDGENVFMGRYCSVCGEVTEEWSEQHHLYRRNGDMVKEASGQILLDGFFGCSDPNCSFNVSGCLELSLFQVEELRMNELAEKTYERECDSYYLFELEEEQSVTLLLENAADRWGYLELYAEESDHMQEVNTESGSGYGMEGRTVHFIRRRLQPGRYYVKACANVSDEDHLIRCGLLNTDYCKINEHIFYEYGRYYDPKTKMQCIQVRCAVCDVTDVRFTGHQHSYWRQSVEYNAEEQMDNLIFMCVCGDSYYEKRKHDHLNYIDQEITAWNGEEAEVVRSCSVCGVILNTETEKHHLYPESGVYPQAGENGQVLLNGTFKCSDENCGFSCYGIMDISGFSTEANPLNQPIRNRADGPSTDVYAFDVERIESMRLLLKYDAGNNAVFELYKAGVYGPERIYSSSWDSGDADSSYDLYWTKLQPGRYYALIRLRDYYQNTYPLEYTLEQADESVCETIGHWYRGDYGYNACIVCGDIVPDSNAIYGNFSTENAIELELNQLTDLKAYAGEKKVFKITLDQTITLKGNFLNADRIQIYDWRLRLFKELDDGRLLALGATAYSGQWNCAAGTYYIVAKPEGNKYSDEDMLLVADENFCEREKTFYQENRVYNRGKRMDEVRRYCRLCGNEEPVHYEKHIHRDLGWMRNGVNTGSALIEQYYRCFQCGKKNIVKPFASIPETAIPVETEEDLTIGVDRENWKVLSFDVPETGEYTFWGQLVSKKYGNVKGPNYYATIYRDNLNGTIRRIIGNAYPDAEKGFRFDKNLNPGHYYAVVRSNSYNVTTLKMHITRESGYCEKNGHSGPITDILETDPESDEVLTERTCTYCGKMYTAVENHLLRYASARLATGSALSTAEVIEDLYCLDCNLIISCRRDLAAVETKIDLNTREEINGIEQSLPISKTARFFTFELNEDQDITLYSSQYSQHPIQDTALYRIEGEELIPVSRTKIPCSYYEHVFKASLTAGRYCYRISSATYDSYRVIIGNQDYCAQNGHYYLYSSVEERDEAAGFCIFCLNPYGSEETPYEGIPENAERIELNQPVKYSVGDEGIDRWLTFTLDHAQNYTAAGATEDNLLVKAALYGEVDGQMGMLMENPNNRFVRNPVYLKAGTYFLHVRAENGNIGEIGSLSIGVFEADYCKENGHLYTLMNVKLFSSGRGFRHTFRCAICCDEKTEKRSTHRHRWGEKYTELSALGNLRDVSICSICKAKTEWASQLVSDMEAILLRNGEKNDVLIREDQDNLFAFDVEEEDLYTLTLREETNHNRTFLLFRESSETGFYDRIYEGEWRCNARWSGYLTEGRYYIVLLNTGDVSEPISTEWTILRGEFYCDRYGHELEGSSPRVESFDLQSGETIISMLCPICMQMVSWTEMHTFTESTRGTDYSRRIAVFLTGSSIEEAYKTRITWYDSEDGSLKGEKYESFLAYTRDEHPLNRSLVYQRAEMEDYLMIPFTACESGDYRIELPENAHFDLYTATHNISIDNAIRCDRLYGEIDRGLSGSSQLTLRADQYVLLVYFDGEWPQQAEIGIFTDGLFLREENGVLTATYSGSKKVVHQGIALYPGECKGDITLDVHPRTRIAFTQTENGSFSLDRTGLPSDMTCRAYVEFEDGTIEYSNILFL